MHSQLQNQIVSEDRVVSKPSRSFIGANTKKVSLDHLKRDCIIPVFSKDNESTISHYQFIQKTREVVQDLFPELDVAEPEVRVSHIIKGRVPAAIDKPAKELLESEKTFYYERCAFIMELPQIRENINGNNLALTVGGVRAYNQENLYSRKSPEKLKIFIGFKNMVCTNLCISTDGLADQVRVNGLNQLSDEVENLLNGYDRDKHLGMMERMGNYKLTEEQFAHFIGKLRMYQHLEKADQKYFSVALNDSQVNTVVKNYYRDSHFRRSEDGSIDFWRLYNLFTEANKSSYIDNNFERNAHAYALTNNLVNCCQNQSDNWFLHN